MKPYKNLNNNKILFGLTGFDIASVGVVILFFDLIQSITLEKSYQSVNYAIALFYLFIMVVVRMKYRKKIIKDFFITLMKYGVVYEPKHYRRNRNSR
jgi:hypothetical protein